LQSWQQPSAAPHYTAAMSLPRSLRMPVPGPRASALLACLLAAACLALPAHAQWKWRDGQGRVTASDLPPPRDVPEKDILQRPNQTARPPAAAAAPAIAASGAPSAPVAAASRPAGDKDLLARKRAAELQAQAKAKADEERNAAVRAENCRRAREHLGTIESGQRMARINERGEREVLDDRARAGEAQRAREVIASDCKP
jgi:hypothetical protein